MELKHNNTELSGLVKGQEENIKLLDEEQKVFTRSDLTEVQLAYLSIKDEHEKIIKKLRPYLLDFRENFDLGSLLVASTIIKLEDDRKNEELIKKYFVKLRTSYKYIGGMVYNLFRSEILSSEVLPHLEKLEKIYDSFEDIRKNFLIYWYTIIKDGYPTAHFVHSLDTDEKISKQIKWRFNRGSAFVDIYSRGKARNNLTKKRCKHFTEDENCKIEFIDKYDLGFTPAMKIRIRPPSWNLLKELHSGKKVNLI